MDFGLSFSYFFKDEEWVKKLVIGSVVFLVAILAMPFLLLGLLILMPFYGWIVGIVRNVNRGVEPVLPEWTDFGELFKDGLKVFAVGIIWLLPLLLIQFCLYALIPVIGSQDSDGIVAAIVGLNTLFNVCIALPYYVIVSLLAPAYIGQLSDDAEFSKALNPVNAFNLVRADFAGYIIVLLVAWFIVPLISTLGLMICLIGFFPAVTYAAAVYAHLSGQAYRESVAAGGLQPG